MDKLKEEDAKKMTEVFIRLFNLVKSRTIQYSNKHAADGIGMSVDEYLYYRDKVAEKGEKLGLLTAERYNDGSFEIISFNDIESTRFISNDCFVGLIKKQKIKRPLWEYIVGGVAILGTASAVMFGFMNHNLAEKQFNFTIEKEECRSELKNTKEQLTLQKGLHKSFVDSIQTIPNVEDSL